MSALVSVIIRAYNRAETLGRAVDSVRQQTYSNWELILIDDGSTDGTAGIAQAWSDVQYFFQKNRGLAGAREAGLERATGDYIAYLDADDFWDSEYLQESIKGLEEVGCDFVFNNWRTEGPGRTHESRLELDQVTYLGEPEATAREHWQALDAAATRSLFMRHQPAVPSGTVFRRSAVTTGWNTQARSADDWLVILDAIVHRQVRCAFHLEKRWTRWIDGKNICEGTVDMGSRARNEIHDTRLILQRFGAQLSGEERAYFEAFVARSQFDLGHIMSKNGESLAALSCFSQAWKRVGLGRVLLAAGKVPFHRMGRLFGR